MASKARAYAEQARADLDAYVASGEAGGVGESYRLQLLQMSLEKLMKAFLYAAEPRGLFSHNVVAKGINAMNRYDVAEAVGLKLPELRVRLEQSRQTFMLIAAASPSIGFGDERLERAESERTANVEYPWQTDAADPLSWVAPASHLFPAVHNLRFNKHAIASLTLLGHLIDAAEAVLGRGGE